jgi:heme/copper-type cytochrome/quinol oxidase subunit 2
MSALDERMIEIRAQRRNDQQAPPATQDAQESHKSDLAGFGLPMGVIILIVSVLLVVPSGGLSLIGVVVAAFAFAGHRVESETLAKMETQPEERNSALMSGCLSFFVLGVIGIVFVLAAVYVLNGGKL